MILPREWAQGSIFAFSGLDGENTLKGSLVGTLSGDRLGIIFNLDQQIELCLSTNNVKGLDYDVVCSDVIEGSMHTPTCKNIKYVITFESQDTIIGITSEPMEPFVNYERTACLKIVDGCIVSNSPGSYSAFKMLRDGEDIIFSFSYSTVSIEAAVEKCLAALKKNVWEEAGKRKSFFSKLPEPNDINELTRMTISKCYSVMKSQVYSKEGMFKQCWTTPDRLPHKNLWLWDSVFHSIGNKYISVDLARDTIVSVLDSQSDDGFIPHMSGPMGSSDATQPPMLAWGIYNLYLYSGNTEILRETYQKLKKYLHWNLENRDVNKNLLFEWKVEKKSVTCRCGECGMDNSPRFDNVVEMDCIDFSCYMANEARDMALISDILEMPGESAYWAGLYKGISKSVNELLWDEQDEFYFDRILETGKLKKVKAVSSFLPLFSGICDKRKAECLVKQLKDTNSFNTKFPIPSISLDDPTFGTDMWRGPVWINYNYMIALGLLDYGYKDLARDIVRKTLDAISFWYSHDGTVYEFYDSMNRVSPRRLNRKGTVIEPYNFNIRYQSIRDYGWSCSLFVAMIMDMRFK